MNKVSGGKSCARLLEGGQQSESSWSVSVRGSLFMAGWCLVGEFSDGWSEGNGYHWMEWE